MESFVVNFREQHVILIDPRVAGQNFSKLSNVRRLIRAHADLHLPRLLRRVQHVHEKVHLPVVLRNRHRHAQERIERVRLPVTPRTRETRPKLGLEHRVHE